MPQFVVWRVEQNGRSYNNDFRRILLYFFPCMAVSLFWLSNLHDFYVDRTGPVLLLRR